MPDTQITSPCRSWPVTRLGAAAAILALAIGLGLALPVPSAPSAAAPAASAPNIVVVQTDDQDLRTMRGMPKTLELLGANGTTFKTHVAAHPVCCPSRSTLLTGQHSHNHGVLSNNAANHGGYSFLDHRETLPVWLERAGYTTAHVGKYMNGTPSWEIPPGWTEWYSTFAGQTERMYNYAMSHNGDIVRYGEAPEDYQTDVFADLAVDFVSRAVRRDRPFYLQVDPLAPHSEKPRPKVPLERNPRPAPRHFDRFLKAPFTRTPSFNERRIRDKPRFLRRAPMTELTIGKIEKRYRDRLGSLLAVDELLERVVAAIESQGELGETMVIFTSDNGYLQGEHRFHRGKRELWEESVRVPLLIAGPGFPAGTAYRGLSANIDLTRTILKAAGAKASGHVLDGLPLQRLVAKPDRFRRRPMLLENGIHGSTAIRTPRWVLITHEKGRELYDLRGDPYQLRSLHASRKRGIVATKRRLSERLRALRKCEGPRAC